MMFRKALIYLMAFSIFMVGCGGRIAHPIMTAQINDYDMDCDLIIHEMGSLEIQYTKKTKEHNVKEAIDVVLLITGIFVFVPWFFIDLKDAEKVEYEAIQNRILHLAALAKKKKCENVPVIYH